MVVDYIVAGAGIWGCTVARCLAERGAKVLVVEKRAAVGGNVRCEIDAATGIEVHTYGSHIFHTNLDEVWDFIRRFAEFNGYQHKVLARHAGHTYFLPLGLTLINQFFGTELTPREVKAFMADEKNSSAIFNAFFRNYTSKQWGKPPEEVDASIIKRVPVRSSYDTNYFNDYRQGIPLDGYNSIFEKMLAHPNITVQTDFDFIARRNELPQVKIFYSGAIDELFGYKFGALPWRSLRFEVERVACADYQGTSVVNYVDADVPFTRIHEYKHFHPENAQVMTHSETIICREYPAAWQLGAEKYYPVETPEARDLLAKYQALAAADGQLIVGGRLGRFKYFDMDKSIADALQTVKNLT